MSVDQQNTRRKSCPICGESFGIRPGTRRKVLNTKVRRHVKSSHQDYYKQEHTWDRRAIFYGIIGINVLVLLFGGVCNRYGGDCGPPIIQEGMSSPFFLFAMILFFAPIAATIYRRWVVTTKFRKDWQETHGPSSSTDKESQAIPTASRSRVEEPDKDLGNIAKMSLAKQPFQNKIRRLNSRPKSSRYS